MSDTKAQVEDILTFLRGVWAFVGCWSVGVFTVEYTGWRAWWRGRNQLPTARVARRGKS